MKTATHSHTHRVHPDHHHRAIAAGLIGTALLLVAACWFWGKIPQAQSVTPRIVDLTTFRLEIADTDATRTQGLSGRDPLKLEEGMLFVFPREGIYPFWMKDMKFGLDIIWLRHGQVVDVVTLPPPGPTDIVPPTHVPTQKADEVLEIDAGRAKQLGLEPGVIVVLP
ncbi:MAG: DUF192 domain-containing protein [Patescibacteria group bacterium]